MRFRGWLEVEQLCGGGGGGNTLEVAAAVLHYLAKKREGVRLYVCLLSAAVELVRLLPKVHLQRFAEGHSFKFPDKLKKKLRLKRKIRTENGLCY